MALFRFGTVALRRPPRVDRAVSRTDAENRASSAPVAGADAGLSARLLGAVRVRIRGMAGVTTSDDVADRIRARVAFVARQEHSGTREGRVPRTTACLARASKRNRVSAPRKSRA